MSSLLLPLITFVFAAAFTPGPNNIMLTASGVNFGFRRTLPHIFGVIVGLPLMILAVGMGLGQIFAAFPKLHEVLKWVGSAYMAFLAWKIATASKPNTIDHESRPLTFMQAALFQWVNPKAWIMAVAPLANFTTGTNNYFVETLIVAGVFFASALGATTSWAFFGTLIGRVLKSPLGLMIFNGFMAALIIASILLLYL
jgi:threonine/homoserine/homoserine lactone efflux protein